VVPKAGGLLDWIALQPRSDPQFRVPAIPIRNVDQAGDLADEGVFITSQDAIRIGDLPQHLDNANAFVFAEIVDAAGITGRSFRERFREHTPKYFIGEYTVLDISDMQTGRRSEVWHGWGWTPAKRAEFAERQTEIREAARRQLAGFRVFVAKVDDRRVRVRLEAAIMGSLYLAPPPLCDLPDRGMSLSPSGRVKSRLPCGTSVKVGFMACRNTSRSSSAYIARHCLPTIG
jgi:hypothetical protein